MLDGLQKLSEMARQRDYAMGALADPSILQASYRPQSLTEQLQSIIAYHETQATNAREALEKLQAVPGIEEFLNAVQKLR